MEKTEIVESNPDRLGTVVSGRLHKLVSHIDYSPDFSYMEFPEQQYCLELLNKVKEIQYVENWDSFDELLITAADLLGNADERYCQIYICESCGCFYHGDYSINPDPDHDYCSSCVLEMDG